MATTHDDPMEIDVVGLDLEVPADVRAQMRDIFLRSYRNGDPDWFDDRMSRLPIVAVGRVGDQVVGFGAVSLLHLDLGPIGSRRVLDAGFICIDPDHRVRGSAVSISQAALRWIDRNLPDDVPELHALTVANPVMIHIVITNEGPAWPDGDIAHVVGALQNPSPCMQLVGRRVAEALGADAYDPERWIMHFDRDHGSAGASFDRMRPEYTSLFEGVDLEGGDRFLFLVWPATSAPPAAWFERTTGGPNPMNAARAGRTGAAST